MGELADEMLDGWSCSHCGIYFKTGHGFPVLCKDCFNEETKEERAGLPRATEEEY
jgi:hypothetical protein